MNERDFKLGRFQEYAGRFMTWLRARRTVFIQWAEPAVYVNGKRVTGPQADAIRAEMLEVSRHMLEVGKAMAKAGRAAGFKP